PAFCVSSTKISSRLAPPISPRSTRPFFASAATSSSASASCAFTQNSSVLPFTCDRIGCSAAISPSIPAGSVSNVIATSYTSCESSFKACRSPRAICRPLFKIKMSSHNSSASLKICVVRTIVRPRADSFRSASITARFRIGSMPVENSSRNSTGVFTRKTFATCTRRRNPPLRSCTLRSASAVRSKSCNDLGSPAFRLSPGEPVKSSIRKQIVAHRKKHLARGFLQHHRHLSANFQRLPDYVKSLNARMPARWLQKCRENLQQRRLASAVRPQHSENRAARYIETKPVNRAHRLTARSEKSVVPRGIHLHDVVGFESERRPLGDHLRPFDGSGESAELRSRFTEPDPAPGA